LLEADLEIFTSQELEELLAKRRTVLAVVQSGNLIILLHNLMQAEQQ